MCRNDTLIIYTLKDLCQGLGPVPDVAMRLWNEREEILSAVGSKNVDEGGRVRDKTEGYGYTSIVSRTHDSVRKCHPSRQ